MFKLLFSTVFLLYLSNVFPKSTALHFLHPFPLNPTPSDTNAHSRFLCFFFSNIVSSQIWLLKCSLFHNFPRLSLCPNSLKRQNIKGIGRSRSSFLVGMFLADQVNTKVSYFLLFIIDLLINILNLSLFQAICIDWWERWFDWQLCEFSHCVSNFCKWLGEDWYHLHNYNNYKNTNTTLAIACQAADLSFADEKEIKLN